MESNLALYAVGQMIGFSVDENGRKFMYSGDFSLDSIKVSGYTLLLIPNHESWPYHESLYCMRCIYNQLMVSCSIFICLLIQGHWCGHCMIFTFHNNILSYYNYFIIHDPTPFSFEGLLSSGLCHLSLDTRRIYPPFSAAFDLQTVSIMSWCRIQQSWDACGWFFGAQVFGEKFLTGDLCLKSEPIPHKVGHSALSAAPVSAVMSSVNDGLLHT